MTLIDILREVECGNVSPDQAHSMIVEAATENLDGRKKVDQSIAARVLGVTTAGILYWQGEKERAKQDFTHEGQISRITANSYLDAFQSVYKEITGDYLP